jgi:hypothetical protein
MYAGPSHFDSAFERGQTREMAFGSLRTSTETGFAPQGPSPTVSGAFRLGTQALWPSRGPLHAQPGHREVGEAFVEASVPVEQRSGRAGASGAPL